MGRQQLAFQKVLIIRRNNTIPNTLTQELGIMKTMGVLLILPILSLVIGVESKAVGNSRILNGQKSDVLRYQVGIGAGSILCGGTLIKPDVVLTTKHCLGIRPLTERAGISNAQDEGQSRIVTPLLSTVIPHEDADLALLRIIPPFELNEKIQPIKINDVYEDLVGKEVLISGWGMTTTNSDPEQLSSLKINISDPKDIPWFSRGNWHLHMLSSNGEGACSGDSGGPAVLGGKNGLLVGVAESVDYFYANMTKVDPHHEHDQDLWCGPGVPNDQGHWPIHLSTYVDVFKFADWIKKHTNQPNDNFY